MKWILRAGDHGYARFRVPAIVSTGPTLLMFAEGRRAMGGDWVESDIVALVDGLDEPVIISAIAPCNEVQGHPRTDGQTCRTCHNPTVFVHEDRVTLLFGVNYRALFATHSHDFGATWEVPIEVTPLGLERVFAVGPGHGLVMSNGRLLAGLWESPGAEGRCHHPSTLRTIYSDDDGESWAIGEVVATEDNPSETQAAEVGGKVLLNIRNEADHGHRMFAWSKDGARNWTKPKRVNGLPEVVCQSSLLAFYCVPYNVLVSTGLARTKPRADLVARFSHDGGKTWPEAEFVHVGAARYSDVAIHHGGLVCLYEAGSQSKGGIALSTLRGAQ